MSNSFTATGTRSLGLRARLMALVLAAVLPFVFLIGMVARQHRFNERANAEQTALDARRLSPTGWIAASELSRRFS